MKKIMVVFILIVLASSYAGKSDGENNFSQQMTVQFNDPAKPGLLKIVSGQGDITITGYNGKDVIIDMQSTDKKSLPSPDNEKARGMKRITGSGLNVTSLKNENTIVIARSMRSETELNVKVPSTTSLNLGGRIPDNYAVLRWDKENFSGTKTIGSWVNYLGGIFQGNITVDDVSGKMEISTLDGTITLKNITGEVVANTSDGDILTTFKSVGRENPMAFSTIDGDIDITFPPDVCATVTANNVDGDIYTDFDMDMVPVVKNESETSTKKNFEAERIVINKVKNKSDIKLQQKNSGVSSNFIGLSSGVLGMFGNSVTGKINGGGPEIQMTTVDGDIYIRKGK